MRLLFPAGSTDWDATTSLLKDSAQQATGLAEAEDDVMGPDRTVAARRRAAAPRSPAFSTEQPARAPSMALLQDGQQQLLQEEQLQEQLQGEAAGDSGAALGEAGGLEAAGDGGVGPDGMARYNWLGSAYCYCDSMLACCHTLADSTSHALAQLLIDLLRCTAKVAHCNTDLLQAEAWWILPIARD